MIENVFFAACDGKKLEIKSILIFFNITTKIGKYINCSI